MKRTIFSTSIAIIAVSVASGVFISQQMPEDEYIPYSGSLQYTPSDITLANEKFEIIPTTTWKTTDISKIKQSVVATFRGTVTAIDKPIEWRDNVGELHGAIPIKIEIEKKTKDTGGTKYTKGDLFTFYVDSLKHNEKFFIASYAPEFEIGEDIVVHIAKSQLGPMGKGGDNYFVELGHFGKYKIEGQKAFNEKFHSGKNIAKALKESQ